MRHHIFQQHLAIDWILQRRIDPLGNTSSERYRFQKRFPPVVSVICAYDFTNEHVTRAHVTKVIKTNIRL